MPSRSLSRLAVVVVVIAAAAAVAVAIGVVVPREPSVAPSGAAVRASQLVAATPAGPIAAVGEFTWMSPYGKAGYRVTVIDDAGHPKPTDLGRGTSASRRGCSLRAR